jgi:hypothetical protein
LVGPKSVESKFVASKSVGSGDLVENANQLVNLKQFKQFDLFIAFDHLPELT